MNPWPGRLWIAFAMLLALIGGVSTGYALNVRMALHPTSVGSLPFGLDRFVNGPQKAPTVQREQAHVRVTRLTYLQARPDEGGKPIEAPLIESMAEEAAPAKSPLVAEPSKADQPTSAPLNASQDKAKATLASTL